MPGHLPRDKVVVDIDSKQCPCCRGVLHLIDETRMEMLDRVPAQLLVKVIHLTRLSATIWRFSSAVQLRRRLPQATSVASLRALV